MTSLQPFANTGTSKVPSDEQDQHARHVQESSTDSNGKFVLSLQVALYNPAVQEGQRGDSSGISVEDLYAMYYTTILSNSIAYLFCTAVQNVLLVNHRNQNVCAALIAARNSNDGSNNDNNPEDDTLVDSVSIGSGTNSTDTTTYTNKINSTDALTTVTPTILDKVPYQVRIVPRNATVGNSSDYANDMFTFSIWYIDYTIIQIGSVYIEEAIIQTGNSGSGLNSTTASTSEAVLDITDVSDEAVKAINVVLQLTLDVNTMDTSNGYGDSKNSYFDTVLQTISNSSQTSNVTEANDGTVPDNTDDSRLRLYLCSSPVVDDDGIADPSSSNIMIQKFTSLYEQYHNTNDNPYRSSTSVLSPMRIGGIVLFVATIALYILLLFLSASRRKRRAQKIVSQQHPPQPQQHQSHRNVVVPRPPPYPQQPTITHHPLAATKKTIPNRVLAVPPSVPSSPMVRLARMDGR